jgi:hypothetical protein
MGQNILPTLGVVEMEATVEAEVSWLHLVAVAEP